MITAETFCDLRPCCSLERDMSEILVTKLPQFLQSRVTFAPATTMKVHILKTFKCMSQIADDLVE